MTSSVRSANPRPQPSSILSLEETDKRKKRLLAVISKGLPTLPNYVLDLNALLGSASVDLKKVGAVIRTDPSLSAQVLRLCNSALFGLRRRVISIEQAAVMLKSPAESPASVIRLPLPIVLPVSGPAVSCAVPVAGFTTIGSAAPVAVMVTV